MYKFAFVQCTITTVIDSFNILYVLVGKGHVKYYFKILNYKVYNLFEMIYYFLLYSKIYKKIKKKLQEVI